MRYWTSRRRGHTNAASGYLSITSVSGHFVLPGDESIECSGFACLALSSAFNFQFSVFNFGSFVARS